MEQSDDEIIWVVDPWEMEDRVFLQHMDARHSNDFRWGPLATAKHIDSNWVGPYRQFHDRLHDIAFPDQYDHDHDWYADPQ